MVKCEYCHRDFPNSKRKCDHHRYCKVKKQYLETITNDTQPKLNLAPVISSPVSITSSKSIKTATTATPANVTSPSVHMNVVNINVNQVTLHQHYNIVIVKDVGRLMLEDTIEQLGQKSCLSRLCKCGKCTTVKTTTPLDTSITQMNHSADKLIKQIFQLGLVKVIEKMPVAQAADHDNLYYGGQREIAQRIKSCVELTERDKNKRMLRNLGIDKAEDVFQYRERLIDALPKLAPMIESQRVMGDNCYHSFTKQTPSGYSDRRSALGSELRMINEL